MELKLQDMVEGRLARVEALNEAKHDLLKFDRQVAAELVQNNMTEFFKINWDKMQTHVYGPKRRYRHDR